MTRVRQQKSAKRSGGIPVRFALCARNCLQLMGFGAPVTPFTRRYMNSSPW
jgi:hypothetical protein